MTSNNPIIKGFKVFELDQRANTYLRETIEYYSLVFRGEIEYPQFLLQEIAKKIELDRGRVVTCLPNQSWGDDIYNFTQAKINVGKTSKLLSQGYIVEVESTREWLVTLLKKYLEFTSDSTVIFKQIYSSPGDSYFLKTKEKVLTTQNEVFFLLTSEESSVDRIRTTIKASDGASPPLIAICTTLPKQLKNGGRLSGEAIDLVVDNIKLIIISVYDGNSYLVWSK